MARLRPHLPHVVDLRPGEGRQVALMLAGSALLGTVSVFLSSAGTAIFLRTFSSQALPYLYLGTALIVAAAGAMYTFLADRVSVKALLPATVAVLLLATVAIRLSLAIPHQTWPALVAAVFVDLAASFAPLTFWAMAGRLFDVRQAKRLFGPIGTGEVAATSLGGFASPFIIARIGTANTFWIAAAALGGLLLVVLRVLRTEPESFANDEQMAEEQRLHLAPTARRWIHDPYVQLMLSFAAVAIIVYYTVSTAFLVQAHQEFPDQDALAGFLGVFTGILSLVSFAGRSVAGWAMERLGIRGSLLLSPLAVAGTAALVLVAGFVPGLVGILFILNSVNRMCMEATWDSFYKPAYLVLYQPLRSRERLWLQAVVEGIAAPLAQGVAGLILLGYRIFLGYEPIGLTIASLVLAMLWMLCGVLTGRQYIGKLLDTVMRRSLDPSAAARMDVPSLQLLEQRLDSGQSSEILYCLDVLEAANYPRLTMHVPVLARHADAEVRVAVMRLAERRPSRDALGAVVFARMHDPEMQVRAAALRAAAAIDPGLYTPDVLLALHDPEPQLVEAALVGLLRYSSERGVQAAIERLTAMCRSTEMVERICAARAIGETKASMLHDLLTDLLDDDAVPVRRTALAAAGQIGSSTLWPAVARNLARSGSARAAARVLLSGGDEALPLLQQVLFASDTPRDLRTMIVRSCGHNRSESAISLLCETLSFPDAELRRQVLRALCPAGYQADQALLADIPALLRREINGGAWISAAQVDMATLDLPSHVQHTFEAELNFARERALLLLAMQHGSSAFVRCADLLLGAEAGQRAKALEILDNLLPHATKVLLFPLLETVPPERRLMSLRAAFPQSSLSAEERLREMVGRPLSLCHPWSRACWIHAAGLLGLPECRASLQEAATLPEPLVAEVARWALWQPEHEQLTVPVGHSKPAKQTKQRAARLGKAPAPPAANGSAANGSAANGSAANGSAANGSAANGSAANGYAKPDAPRADRKRTKPAQPAQPAQPTVVLDGSES